MSYQKIAMDQRTDHTLSQKYLKKFSITSHMDWEIIWRTIRDINSLSANPTKWSNTLKKFVGNSPTNGLSVCDHFGGLAL